MALTVNMRREDGFGILEMAGTLTLSPGLVEVRNKAKQLLDGQKLDGLIIEVGAVTRTDTSGLGELTTIYTAASKKSCPLRLVNVKPDLRKILQLTHLDVLLPSAPDIASAKNEMKKPRANSSTA